MNENDDSSRANGITTSYTAQNNNGDKVMVRVKHKLDTVEGRQQRGGIWS